MLPIATKLTPRAILLDVVPLLVSRQESLTRLEEAEALVHTYGGIVIAKTMQKRGVPDYQTFVGSGKIGELQTLARELGANYLILNNALKYRQIYALGEKFRVQGVAVWDRLDLILKIFARHARTTEAKLEIELASIRHMGPRIYGMGMELSRQGGGIGTSGVGETNTEIMRRHLAERSEKILKKIAECEQVRKGHRAARRRQGFKTISLVGYTNAGKTSLYNALARRKELAINKLFATLDTRVGSLYLPKARATALISDTIGFIRDLPPELLKAFSSTLSEAIDADLLLHVIDAADTKWREHLCVVDEILERLGVAGTPRILIFNKIDVAPKSFDQTAVQAEFNALGKNCVFMSAILKRGFAELIDEIEKRLLL